ncbi:MAG TPA: FtsX-like permease family protein [Glaciihabitans sp.]|nr:FtsX-like permease family protein [Glaciihabitans sp.]
MIRSTLRGNSPSVLVAALSSAFGVCLLHSTNALGTMIRGDDVTGSSDTAAFFLSVVALVFIAVAVFVGSIVTVNTFATIIAGRTRTIALMRLIGSSARQQRRQVAKEGLTVGIIGSALGAIIGTALAVTGIAVSTAAGAIPALDYRYFELNLILPIVAVALTTWLASWIGSRRVLDVSPIHATGAAEEMTHEQSRSRRGRNTVAITLFALGMLILLAGTAIGMVSPLGVLVGVVGGFLSFTGVVLGAHLVMPYTLRVVGRAFGRSAPGKLAAENAVRYPERSSRTTIGLVIGVTLVTMFAVAIESFQVFIAEAQKADPLYYTGIDEMMVITITVLSVLTGFSALIAALGLVNTLSLSVMQRTRELGLLRALGFTARQVRQMILVESAQLTVAAVLVGLVLGTVYGWAGAQATFGSIQGSPGIIVPAVPFALLAGVVVAAAVLTWAASVAPSRRATRIAPVEALAVQ